MKNKQNKDPNPDSHIEVVDTNPNTTTVHGDAIDITVVFWS